VRDTRLRCSLVTLGDPGRRTGGYRYDRIMAAAAPDHGAEIRFASIPALPWFASIVRAGAVLRRAARADAVLLDSIAAAFAAPLIGRLRAPVIAIVHQPLGGTDEGRWHSLGRRWLDRLAYRAAAGFVATSESLVEQLREIGIRRRRIRFVPPGCDVPRTNGARIDLRRGREVSMLCVANWAPHKGILELLDAFARIRPDAATLWLVGETDVDRRYASQVRRRLASPDLSGRVVVAGTRPIEEVGRLYASADVFALPSFVDPYGMAWAEAIAAGLPVVGWRAGNLPRLAEHGREALLVAPGDVRALSEALRVIASDPIVREGLAAGARRRAGELPTWRRSTTMFFDAVRELLATATA
jgi:glycosyltransferase involved in cell wall biosynthesis